MSGRACRRLPNPDVRPLYERLIGPLRAVAAKHGYALAVHGTLARDIDLIAVPWRIDVSDACALVEAIRTEAEAVSGRRAFCVNDPSADPRDYTRRSPEPKPHGRLGWSIYLGGATTYIDLSVMPAGDRQIRAYPDYPPESTASVLPSMETMLDEQALGAEVV